MRVCQFRHSCEQYVYYTIRRKKSIHICKFFQKYLLYPQKPLKSGSGSHICPEFQEGALGTGRSGIWRSIRPVIALPVPNINRNPVHAHLTTAPEYATLLKVQQKRPNRQKSGSYTRKVSAPQRGTGAFFASASLWRAICGKRAAPCQGASNGAKRRHCSARPRKIYGTLKL